MTAAQTNVTGVGKVTEAQAACYRLYISHCRHWDDGLSVRGCPMCQRIAASAA
jgi:hypothetical protein